jgi:hypothetical protein
LNVSWIIAPANARRNLSLSPIWPRLTNADVILVPIFTPYIIGIATGTWTTIL